MKRCFLFSFIISVFMLFAQDDTLFLPFDATTLTDEQKNSNPDCLAYQVPELQSYQSTDCIEAVDLGLSVLWATCNVGASSPEDYGDYFAWGEVTPKEHYDWSTYKHCKGSPSTFTKYCNMSLYGYNGFTDTITVLVPEDDAATVNWGVNWRMPTEAERTELCEKCTWIWIALNGVDGYKVVGPNGNSIFLPEAGCMNYDEFVHINGAGYYWSSSLHPNNYDAYDVFFSPIFVSYRSGNSRRYGLPVRPVYLKEEFYKFVNKDTICGSDLPYVWRGKECNASGLYSDSLKTLSGGDSIYVLELTVLPADECDELSDCIEAVDLGLSVLWATCNVGASAPEDYGDYFAWGETKPKGYYFWDTYKFGDLANFTKYNSVDGLTRLALEDDAAAVNWGGYWRMPTVAEMEELFDNCSWTWTTKNGINGYQVMGRNGQSIFLPAAGFCDWDDFYDEGEFAGYWMSELGPYVSDGTYLAFTKNTKYKNKSFFRYRGYSIRPVCVMPDVVEDTVTVCAGESYWWNGMEYSASGVYVDTLQSVNGKDSIIILNLIVLPEVVGVEDSVTICYGETYTWRGVEYSNTGVYRDTLQSAQGCDSVVILNLKVAHSYSGGDNVSLQPGESYEWRGESYSVPGVYIDKLLTVDGCDSVFTLTIIRRNVVVDAINIAEQCAGTGVLDVEVLLSSGLADEVSFIFNKDAINAGFVNVRLPYDEHMQVQYTDVRAGRYKVTVMGLFNGEKVFEEEKDLIFLYPSTVLMQKWNDVVAVLTHDYNGGYNFVDFQWYKNGVVLSGETRSYIHQPLELGAEYSALLTEDNGLKMMTCPLIATNLVDISLYPTLLNSGQRVRCNLSESAVVYIYDMMGKLLSKLNVQSGETEMEMPYVAGVYVVKIVTNSNDERNIKLIVR